MFKVQIIARLKALFPGINLSNARLDAIADKLKITEESEIDAKLNELNEVFPFADVARQDDRIRNLDNNPKPTDPPKPANPPATPPAVPDDATMPPWAKALLEQNKTLVDKVNAIETGKTVDTRKSQLEAVLKDAPEAFKKTVMKAFDRMKFDKEEDFTSYLDEVKTDSAEYVQQEANTSLGQNRRPIVPTGGGSGKTASKEEVADVMKVLMPNAAKANNPK
jgi:hypothetical protein